MMKQGNREFLPFEDAMKVIEKIRNSKVNVLVCYFVERGCWLTLYGNGDFCNVYSPKARHNILGDIAIDSVNGSFKIQLARNEWKGLRNEKLGLDIEGEDFVQAVIERINMFLEPYHLDAINTP